MNDACMHIYFEYLCVITKGVTEGYTWPQIWQIHTAMKLRRPTQLIGENDTLRQAKCDIWWGYLAIIPLIAGYPVSVVSTSLMPEWLKREPRDMSKIFDLLNCKGTTGGWMAHYESKLWLRVAYFKQISSLRCLGIKVFPFFQRIFSKIFIIWKDIR